MSKASFADGWVCGVKQVISPNFDERPPGSAIRLVVVHAISLPPDEFGGTGVLDFFSNNLDIDAHPYFEQIRGLKVSAHFFIPRRGEWVQLVSCCQRAWHAGASNWQGLPRCNDFSVGIELEGSDNVPFADTQYSALNHLLELLFANYPIEAVVGHSDIAPGRKTDPGPFFDWNRVSTPHQV